MRTMVLASATSRASGSHEGTDRPVDRTRYHPVSFSDWAQQRPRGAAADFGVGRSSPRAMDALIASISRSIVGFRKHRRVGQASAKRASIMTRETPSRPRSHPAGWGRGGPALPFLQNRFDNAASPGNGFAWPKEYLRAG